MKARERNPQKNTDSVSMVNKKLLDVDEAMYRYSMGKNSVRKMAQEAGAEFHYGSKIVRYDVEKMDAYVEALRAEN